MNIISRAPDLPSREIRCYVCATVFVAEGGDMKSESTYSKQDDLNKLPRRGTHKIKSYYRYGVRCPVCRVYHVIDSDEYATDIDMNCNPTSYPE